MKILVTGNMGYVGPVVVAHLRNHFPHAELIGFDNGYFAHCLTTDVLPERLLSRQCFGDIRELPEDMLDGVDALIHLAAISNDPMGSQFEAVTGEINHVASLRIAELAARHGVSNFVFASSCSVYGEAGPRPRNERDEVLPLTAYAHSKINTERGLARADLGEMVVTCLRFATACGMSDRLRLDLVLNDFVASALATGEISVLSDGTPWRPLIEVRDMARAVHWATTRRADNGGRFLVVNAGSDNWNYQVRQLAEAVGEGAGAARVTINSSAPPDRRSYQVDFSLFRMLAPNYLPKETLVGTIERLRMGLEALGFSNADFRNSSWMRLKVLRAHIAAGRLLPDLRWFGQGAELEMAS